MATAVQTVERENYLNSNYGIKSWLLTTDHKRIAMLYLISITAMFWIGGFFAMLIRLELLTPAGDVPWSRELGRELARSGLQVINEDENNNLEDLVELTDHIASNLQTINEDTNDLDELGNDFEKSSKGFIDFVLLDQKGFPFIVLEAKAENLNPLDRVYFTMQIAHF